MLCSCFLVVKIATTGTNRPLDACMRSRRLNVAPLSLRWTRRWTAPRWMPSGNGLDFPCRPRRCTVLRMTSTLYLAKARSPKLPVSGLGVVPRWARVRWARVNLPHATSERSFSGSEIKQDLFYFYNLWLLPPVVIGGGPRPP